MISYNSVSLQSRVSKDSALGFKKIYFVKTTKVHFYVIEQKA